MRQDSNQGRRSSRCWARKLLSYSTYSGFVPPPPALRPFGLSAITMAKNEEDWAEASVRSIVNFVDEVLVADHGSEDGTPKILESVAKSFPGKVRLIAVGDRDFPSAINLMISRTRYRWILRWHADFIARTSGPFSVAGLVDRVRRLDRRRHFCVALSGYALDGDLDHQFPERRDHPEPFLYTYSPWLRYGVRERWESLHIPWFYQKETWSDAYYFHMRSVKSSRRMLQRLYWSRWFDARNKGSQESMRDFIRRLAIDEFGTASVEEAARKFVVEEFQGCLPFSREICGDYPAMLVPILADPPYRLMYEKGKVVSRLEKPRNPAESKA